MIAVLMLLTIVTISIVITRNATIALIYTGLVRESAHHSYVDADWKYLDRWRRGRAPGAYDDRRVI